eukprot:3434879-Pyramimonas_sp.AAC.1
MRTAPLGPSVELPMGLRNVRGARREQRQRRRGGRREEAAGGRGRKETRGTVSSKRGPNTAG